MPSLLACCPVASQGAASNRLSRQGQRSVRFLVFVCVCVCVVVFVCLFVCLFLCFFVCLIV